MTDDLKALRDEMREAKGPTPLGWWDGTWAARLTSIIERNEKEGGTSKVEGERPGLCATPESATLKALRDEMVKQTDACPLGCGGSWAARLTSIIERNEKPQLIACDVCGAHLMPGRLCDDCLYKYRPPAFIERNEKERAGPCKCCDKEPCIGKERDFLEAAKVYCESGPSLDAAAQFWCAYRALTERAKP